MFGFLFSFLQLLLFRILPSIFLMGSGFLLLVVLFTKWEILIHNVDYSEGAVIPVLKTLWLLFRNQFWEYQRKSKKWLLRFRKYVLPVWCPGHVAVRRHSSDGASTTHRHDDDDSEEEDDDDTGLVANGGTEMADTRVVDFNSGGSHKPIITNLHKLRSEEAVVGEQQGVNSSEQKSPTLVDPKVEEVRTQIAREWLASNRGAQFVESATAGGGKTTGDVLDQQLEANGKVYRQQWIAREQEKQQQQAQQQQQRKVEGSNADAHGYDSAEIDIR